MSIERAFNSFCELIRKVSTKPDNQINDFRVHVRIIQQRPQLLECESLIIHTCLFRFLLEDECFDAGVYAMFVLPH